MILYPTLGKGDVNEDWGVEESGFSHRACLSKQHSVKAGCSLLVPGRYEWWQIQFEKVKQNSDGMQPPAGGLGGDTNALNSYLLSTYYVLCPVLGITQQEIKQTEMPDLVLPVF